MSYTDNIKFIRIPEPWEMDQEKRDKNKNVQLAFYVHPVQLDF